MADPIIQVAVMGATGTGKSTFIKLLTSDRNIRIGHSTDSETSEIRTSSYTDQRTGRSVTLIDTPGFDDSREGITDTDILERIVQYLEPENCERRKLNGIIYMHRISDPRVGGVSRKNLRMFHSLCGEGGLKNVRVVTTNWDRVSEQEGNHREVDLKSGAFKALVDAGAQICRHANTLESARQIMSELIPLQAVMMQVQEELHRGKTLAETAAGRVLAAEMAEMERLHALEMDNIRRGMELDVKWRIACVNAEPEEMEWRLMELIWEEENRAEEERANTRFVWELLEQLRRDEQVERDRHYCYQLQFEEGGLQ